MHSLPDSNRPKLYEALGRLAIAHTHLELILRCTVKTLSGSSVRVALDDTRGKRISALRKRIKKLFKQKGPSPMEKSNLDALLEKAKRLSETRNSYLHKAWSETDAGQAVLKGESHQWEPAPSETEVEQVASEILELGKTINHARQNGFIHEVVERHKGSGLTALPDTQAAS
jgi:hypothetical protein